VLSSVLEERFAKLGCALAPLDKASVEGNVVLYLTLPTAALAPLDKYSVQSNVLIFYLTLTTAALVETR
jgi:hypothetical protein